MSILQTEAKALGLQIACVKSLSPMEFYVLAKQHPTVSGVYRGRGLPQIEVARLKLTGDEQDSQSPDQGVSDESPSP